MAWADSGKGLQIGEFVQHLLQHGLGGVRSMSAQPPGADEGARIVRPARRSGQSEGYQDDLLRMPHSPVASPFFLLTGLHA